MPTFLTETLLELLLRSSDAARDPARLELRELELKVLELIRSLPCDDFPAILRFSESLSGSFFELFFFLFPFF